MKSAEEMKARILWEVSRAAEKLDSAWKFLEETDEADTGRYTFAVSEHDKAAYAFYTLTDMAAGCGIDRKEIVEAAGTDLF